VGLGENKNIINALQVVALIEPYRIASIQPY
jgi:hypothetical protein